MGLIDIVVGLVTLVVDAGIVAISTNIPDVIEPQFLNEGKAFDYQENNRCFCFLKSTKLSK